MITLQQIFDNAWNHFIVGDGQPAAIVRKEHRPRCRYLTEDGRKCAIGLSIPDGHPAQDEVCPFSALIRNYGELFSPDVIGLTEVEANFIQRQLHDWCIAVVDGKAQWRYSKEQLKAQYIETAKLYCLKVPE